MCKWYAIFVETGKEDNVKESLQHKFRNEKLKVLVPKRKMRERKNGRWVYKVKTLFPGYLLINGLFGTEEYYKIKGTPGMIRLLGDKNGPIEIQENEISIISSLISENEIIGISSILVESGRAIVVDGPLLGMDGIIAAIDKRKGRVKVRLDFIGEQRLVELSVNMLQPA